MYKCLCILTTSGHLDAIQKMLEDVKIEGYTVASGLQGYGKSGKRLDTKIWPGTCDLILTINKADKTDDIIAALRVYANSISRYKYGMKVFSFSIETIL